MPLAPQPDLPAAVPPMERDFDHACRELGRALLYVAQLSTLLTERAAEANTLDDQLQAARLRVQELERQVQALTADNERLGRKMTDATRSAVLATPNGAGR